MKSIIAITAPRLVLGLCPLACFLAACSQITHVPPGQSVAFSTAPRADFVTAPAIPEADSISPPDVVDYYTGPAVEPDLPTADFTLPEELAQVENAESFAIKGNDYLAVGENEKAIEALERAVLLEPSLSTAWRNLALAYENTNQTQKAMEAYRNFKNQGGL